MPQKAKSDQECHLTASTEMGETYGNSQLLLAMKSLFALIATAAFALPAAQADDEVEILYSASSKKNPFVSASQAARDLEQVPLRSVIRAQHDGFVYRREGIATARHDEIMSAVVSWYVTFEEPTKINWGHSLAR